jgi:hypothetical protein
MIRPLLISPLLYELTSEESSQESTVPHNESTVGHLVLLKGVGFSIFAFLIGIILASFDWIRRLVCFSKCLHTNI